MQLSQKQKIFSEFFFVFSKFSFNFKNFSRKMTLIVDVFLNLPTPKNVVREMSKKSRFESPFDK